MKIRTQYKHLTSQIVNVGDTIARGQKIGTLGRTEILSGGLLHLHFEVQIEGRLGIVTPVNPNAYWANGLNNITCFDPLADRQTNRSASPIQSVAAKPRPAWHPRTTILAQDHAF